MLGGTMILVLMTLFLPNLIDMFENRKGLKIKEKIKKFAFSKTAFITKNGDKRFLISLLIVMMLPYFHGSALITALLILFGMAIFSENRLSYLAVAIVAVIFSIMQTTLFSGGAGNVVGISIEPGFMAPGRSMFEILKYIFTVTGLLFLVAFLYLLINRKAYHFVLFFAFLLPVIFAFVFKLTVEIAANHKFITYATFLFDIFAASFITYTMIPISKESSTSKRKLVYSILSIIRFFAGLIILVVMTLTGIYEWIIFINKNKYTIQVPIGSEMQEWIITNTNNEDMFLTPMWSIHDFFLAGRPSFFGWPYYAFSAGHDTDSRGKLFEYLLSGAEEDRDNFVNICKEYKIKYFIDSDEYIDNLREAAPRGVFYNLRFIENNFEMVAEFEYNNTRIFKIY